MSENAEPQTPEIPHTPAPEPKVERPEAPESKGNDSGGEGVDPNELEALRAYKKHAGYLMRQTDATLTQQKREALTFIMEQEGFGRDEIYRYLDAMEAQANGPQMEPTADDEEEYDMGDGYDDSPRESVRGNSELEELRAEIQRLKDSQRRDTTQVLRGRLNGALEREIERGVGGLLKTVARLNPEGVGGFSESIRADLEKEIIDRLSRRRDTAGTFDINWVDEEASRATESLVKKYRAVIGDPDRVARVPETDTGSDGIRRIEPPKRPKFDPGKDDMASVSTKARSFTEQALRSLADEVDKGGKTVM